MFQIQEVKWSTTVWTQPDQNLPRFLFWFFALLFLSYHTLFCISCTVFLAQLLEQVIYLFILQSACNGKLEEAWIFNKSMNYFFASLVVKSNQKSIMILKMLLSLKALSVWGSWHRVSLKLINGGSVPQKILRWTSFWNQLSKITNVLDSYWVFRFFVKWNPLTCSR